MQSTANAALHRSLRLTEHHRDIAIRVPAEERELDRAPLVLRQHVEGVSQVRGQQAVPHLEVVVVRGCLGLRLALLTATARARVSMMRNARSDPRSGSKRSGCSHSRTKTSWTTSSAIPSSRVTWRAT